MIPKNGEIWTVEYGGTESLVLVVAAHDTHCTTLKLNDTPRTNSDIKVIAKSEMYTDPSMISYRYNSSFVEFVKAMPDDEYKDLMGYVADALCIKADDSSDEVYDLHKELAALMEERDNLKKRLAEAMTVDAHRLKAERDVFKSLYEETLVKLINGR